VAILTYFFLNQYLPFHFQLFSRYFFFKDSEKKICLKGFVSKSKIEPEVFKLFHFVY